MPVKKRTAKAREHKITPAAVASFRAALATAERYASCVGGAECDSTAPDAHCAACREHLDASAALRRALNVRPWEPSPIDCRTDDPPDWCQPGDLWTLSWAAMRSLRLALEAAAK